MVLPWVVRKQVLYPERLGAWVEYNAFFHLGVLPGLRLAHLLASEAALLAASALVTPPWRLAAELLRSPELLLL